MQFFSPPVCTDLLLRSLVKDLAPLGIMHRCVPSDKTKCDSLCVADKSLVIENRSSWPRSAENICRTKNEKQGPIPALDLS